VSCEPSNRLFLVVDSTLAIGVNIPATSFPKHDRADLQLRIVLLYFLFGWSYFGLAPSQVGVSAAGRCFSVDGFGERFKFHAALLQVIQYRYQVAQAAA